MVETAQAKNESIEKSAYSAEVKEILVKMETLLKEAGGVLSNMPMNSEYWILQSQLGYLASQPRVYPETMTRELKEALKSAVPTSTIQPLKGLLEESQKPDPLGKKSLEERLAEMKASEKAEKAEEKKTEEKK